MKDKTRVTTSIAIAQTVLAVALSLVAFRLVDQATELNRVQEAINTERDRAREAREERDALDERLDLLNALLKERGFTPDDLNIPGAGVQVRPTDPAPVGASQTPVPRQSARVVERERGAAPGATQAPPRRPPATAAPRPTAEPIPRPIPLRPLPTQVPLLKPVCNLLPGICAPPR